MPTCESLQQAINGMTAVNHAVNLGLTTAIIAPLTTVTGLQAAITALGTNINTSREAVRINRTLDYVKNAGILTNTNVAAADTVAGLRAIFTAVNSNLPTYHSTSHLDG